MELLINQVGYDCDGHKIALLQTDANVEISGLVRLRRLHDDRLLLEVPLPAEARCQAGKDAPTGVPTSAPSRSPATTGWRPSQHRA